MGRSRLLFERVLPLAILGVAIVAVPTMILAPSGLQRLHQLETERTRVDAQISSLAQRIRQLKARVKSIKEDPTAVEQAARDELGLVRKTEVVFHFSRP